MAKNERSHGHSARRGSAESAYSKQGKRPHIYSFQVSDGRTRLSNGDLKVKANDRLQNKYA